MFLGISLLRFFVLAIALSNNAVQAVHGMSEVEVKTCEYPFPANGILNVTNAGFLVNGTIVIQEHDANTLVIQSVKRTRIGCLKTVEINISIVNGVATIETIGLVSTEPGVCDYPACVAYTIKVPVNTMVQVINGNWVISSEGIETIIADDVHKISLPAPYDWFVSTNEWFARSSYPAHQRCGSLQE